jgi:hypothetical protein
MLGLFLALGLIVSSALVSRTVENIKLSRRTISVKGYAERGIVSDVAVWRGRFASRHKDLVPAYEKLQSDLDLILGYLEKNGVPKGAVKADSADIMAMYRKTEKGIETSEVESFILSQAIELTSTNVQQVAQIARDCTSLIKQGVEFASSPPVFYVSKINDFKLDLLGEATRNAQLRSEQLARNTGSRVGDMVYASQGVFQITPVNSTEVTDSGIYDTSTIEKTIKAVVSIEFALRRR